MISIKETSDFQSLMEDVDGLKKDLDSIRKKYSSVLSEIDSSASSIDFNDWNDDIEKELNNYLSDDFKNGCNKISTDLESGNFVILYNSVSNLLTELLKCFQCKGKIDCLNNQLSNTSKTVQTGGEVTYDADGTAIIPTTDNFVYEELEKQLKLLKEELSGYVYNCNDYLKTISSITFVGTFNKVGINDLPGIDSSPSTCYNSIPDNLSEDYHPELIFDFEHGVDAAQNPITKFLRLFVNYPVSDQGLHFVYNEKDGCYYEVNQDLNNAGNVMNYEDIPEGESPSEYGYKPFSIDDINKLSVVVR